MFFEKLNFYFSKKAKFVTFCHHLGKARVKEASSKVLVTTSIEEHRLGFPKIGRDSRFDLRSPSYGARKVVNFRHF